mgnify:CR=1 FL=1
MADFDLVVLGAGPGGYVAAIRASQLGLKVAVVEKKYWGGVCLNVGCIPSKALIKNAELAHTLTHDKKKFGIEGDATMSFGPTHARSRQVSAGIVKGVHFLMKKNKITEIDGWGTLTSATSMSVATDDGSTREVTFDKLIIAAGATTRMLPGMEVSRNVVTYEEQILDENLPGSIIIAGSGAIGVEFAYVLKNFGVDVTIVEFLDRMVPTEDADVSKELAKHYKKLGVKVMTGTKVEKAEDTGSGVKVTVTPAKGGDAQVLEADRTLIDAVRAAAPLPKREQIKVRCANAALAASVLPPGMHGTVDVLVVDVFAGARTPAGLTTSEFFASLVPLLAPGAVVVLNIADGAPLAFARSVTATVVEVFGDVAIAAEPAVLKGRRFGNLVLVAGTVPEQLARRLAGDPFPGTLLWGADATRFGGGAKPFTSANAQESPMPPRGVFG